MAVAAVTGEKYKILLDGDGGCEAILKQMRSDSVDAVVTDPPYGLSNHSVEEVTQCLAAWIDGKPFLSKNKGGFMGKSWDSWVPGPEIWKEVFRVLKPGGHVLVFAGTRSMDLMCMALRLSGFELRDSIGWAHDNEEAPLLAWVYGSGFPKSHDISKAIDKAAGAEREVTGYDEDYARRNVNGKYGLSVSGNDNQQIRSAEKPITAPSTDAAKQWAGWGTALKPAWEPIILARKPVIGTVAANVLEHGTGALNIDGCRVEAEAGGRPLREVHPLREGVNYSGNSLVGRVDGTLASSKAVGETNLGRWPANLIHDGSDEVVGLFPQVKGATSRTDTVSAGMFHGGNAGTVYDDGANTSAARFFYCAKASKRDRDEGNGHPTVKPTALMRYLCRLVTPPGGIVVDPFMGSGSTGKACAREGFLFIGMEIEKSSFEIAQARVTSAYTEGEQLRPESVLLETED